MRRFLFSLTLALVIAIGPLLISVNQAHASSVSASDLINWMNSLRVSNGFSPLVEDALLDQSAASAAYDMYAQYANTYTCGHPGGKMDRIIATGYGGGASFSATENIACATSADLAWFAQYNVWGDPEHQYPATEGVYTRVGAFAYSAPNGVTYYVLHAASGSGVNANTESTIITDQPDATQDLSNYKNPIILSTPNEDGSIKHVIASGQTLYDIATYYGVGYETIKILNNLTGDDIYAGDTLIIRLAPTVTITPTRTVTVQMPTRTQTPTSMPTTPRPTRTITPTPDPKAVSGLPEIDRQWVGLGLLVLSAVGFFVVFYFLFLRPATKKPSPAAASEQPNKPEEKTPVIAAAKPLQKPVKKTTSPSAGSPPKKAARKTKTEIPTDEPKKAARKTKPEPENIETKKTVKKKKADSIDGDTIQE